MYTFRADGSEARCMTENGMRELMPRLSPSGAKIAFGRIVGKESGGNVDIWQLMVMNRDGSDARALDASGYDGLVDIKWSPDGQYILTVGAATEQLTLFGVDD